jgi:hypothetical protein
MWYYVQPSQRATEALQWLARDIELLLVNQHKKSPKSMPVVAGSKGAGAALLNMLYRYYISFSG